MSNQEAERLFAGWRALADFGAAERGMEPEAEREVEIDGWLASGELRAVWFRGRSFYQHGSRDLGALFTREQFVSFTAPTFVLMQGMVFLPDPTEGGPVGLGYEIEAQS